ncbi:MAG: metallophosphoesterase [Candidatus Acidiferrum sp.]
MKILTRLFFSLIASGIAIVSAYAQTQPAALDLKTSIPFHFVAFGDTRFHDPADTKPANPEIRHALVAAIAQENPVFISIGGDIVFDGDNAKDWHVWDAETSLWRERKIPVYPAIGNHDLHGDLNTALANYFQRFPELQNSRFYSARVANSLMLVLDSNLGELSGPQGAWLAAQLDHLPDDVDFVFFVFHHPPYTSSSDLKIYGGGHSARPTEQALAKMLEQRQQGTRARFIVFSGHVHNYERHEHRGVTYFVTGGGGARPYLIARAPGDLYKDMGVNYHYLLVEVDHTAAKITMHKVEIKDGSPVWSTPDGVTISVPAAAAAAAGKAP